MSNPYLLLAFSTIYIPTIHYCWKLKSFYFVMSPHLSLCVKMVHKPPGVSASLELWLRFCDKWKCWSLSHVWLFATPRNIAHQAPLSMEFSRQEFWSGLPFPSPGDLPNPRIEPRSPAQQADSLLSELWDFPYSFQRFIKPFLLLMSFISFFFRVSVTKPNRVEETVFFLPNQYLIFKKFCLCPVKVYAESWWFLHAQEIQNIGNF